MEMSPPKKEMARSKSSLGRSKTAELDRSKSKSKELGRSRSKFSEDLARGKSKDWGGGDVLVTMAA